MKAQLFALLAFYLRRFTSEKGRYRLLKFARPLGRSSAWRLGNRSIHTKHNFVMSLDLQDWIPQDIYLTGDFEPKTSAVVKQLLKPGDIVVDVGANIGFFTLLFAQHVGPAGMVHAFEPVPALSSKLAGNVALNRMRQVKIYSCALSDRSGTARFCIGPPDNTGLSSLREPRQSSGSFEAKLARLDDVIGADTRVELVKIDVEGAELQVLRGMTGILCSSRPAVIVEVTDTFLAELGDSAEALLNFMEQHEYICHLIGDSQLIPLPANHAGLPRQCNALFTPREKSLESRLK